MGKIIQAYTHVCGGNVCWHYRITFAIRKFNPDIVVGLGGYASVAPIIAAKLLSIPSVLLEQNVIPGKANRFLTNWGR